MDISKPILTEPGVKYFLKETLKNCKIKKDTEFNKIINLALLTSFIVIFCGLLYYKYKTRPTPEDRNKIKQLKKDYFINKVRQLEAKKAKQLDKQITNLPQFESPFELLHKNFYKT
jgi:signal transduction histidine kinase|tara:strand:- start:526 stop:873 length:348 start_codon:yes stop_codon:yes gene_type:complete